MRVLVIIAVVGACTSSKQLEVRKEARGACIRVVAADLRASAENAVGLTTQLTLALPIAWPADNEGVMYLAYPAEPLPTEMHTIRLRSPSHRIVFAPTNARPRVEALAPSRVLGTQDDAPEPVAASRVAIAEQALVDVTSGCRTADQAAVDVEPYVQWLDDEPVIARDLAERNAAFIGWLRERDQRR